MSASGQKKPSVISYRQSKSRNPGFLRILSRFLKVYQGMPSGQGKQSGIPNPRDFVRFHDFAIYSLILKFWKVPLYSSRSIYLKISPINSQETLNFPMLYFSHLFICTTIDHRIRSKNGKIEYFKYVKKELHIGIYSVGWFWFCKQFS